MFAKLFTAYDWYSARAEQAILGTETKRAFVGIALIAAMILGFALFRI